MIFSIFEFSLSADSCSDARRKVRELGFHVIESVIRADNGEFICKLAIAGV